MVLEASSGKGDGARREAVLSSSRKSRTLPPMVKQVAVLEPAFAHRPAVDEDPVPAAQIDQGKAPALRAPQLAVVTRNLEAGQLQIVVGMAADDEAVATQRKRLTFDEAADRNQSWVQADRF